MEQSIKQLILKKSQIQKLNFNQNLKSIDEIKDKINQNG